MRREALIWAGVRPAAAAAAIARPHLAENVVTCHATGANASVLYVPPAFAADAILEGIDAKVG